MATPAVELRGVMKSYRHGFAGRLSAEVLRGLDLTVEAGCVHGLLGPNGAGKTTTLKLLLGFIFPDAGRVAVFGGDPAVASVRADLGFLPEQPYFHPAFTGRETMRYLTRLRAPLDEKVLGQALEEVGLGGAADRRVSAYSRGMLQRLGLAQAMAGGPGLLVLDEPSLGLDPLGQEEFNRIIGRLSGQGKTILLSSHQLSAVEETCDSVTFLIAGRAAASGPMDEQLASPDTFRLVLGAAPEGGVGLPDGGRILDDGSREYILAGAEKDEALRWVVAAGNEVRLLEPVRRSLEERFLELAGDAR